MRPDFNASASNSIRSCPQKNLAIQHPARRTDDTGRNRILAVLVVQRADFVRRRSRDEFGARQARLVGKPRHGGRVSQIEFVLPDTRKGATHERLRIKSRGDGRDHHAVGQSRTEREKSRLAVERQPALVAPALQFHQPVALARRMTLGQRQTSRLGKHLGQKNRFVIDLQSVLGREALKQRVPDIGPWRLDGKIVVNLARHRPSGCMISVKIENYHSASRPHQ